MQSGGEDGGHTCKHPHNHNTRQVGESLDGWLHALLQVLEGTSISTKNVSKLSIAIGILGPGTPNL
jgi:hypothetical protein